MAQLAESVVNVIDQLAKLPGIGRKSAERLAYHILRINKSEALALADAIRNVRENVRYCGTCFNLAEADQCEICRDPKRDQNDRANGNDDLSGRELADDVGQRFAREGTRLRPRHDLPRCHQGRAHRAAQHPDSL